MPPPDPPTPPDAPPRSGQRGAAPEDRLRALTQIVAVAFVTILLVLAATTVGPWQLNPLWDIQDPAPSLTPSSQPTSEQSQSPSDQEPFRLEDIPTPDLSWLAIALSVIAAAVVLLIVLRLLAYLRRPREEDPPPPSTVAALGEVDAEPDLPVLHEGVRDAAAQLALIGPPRDAIVAAWLALEHAAERSGVPRKSAQTPTEHATAVLARTGADPAATQTLLHLYHRARFSSRELRPADVAEAGRALEALAASWPELATGRDAEPDAGPGSQSDAEPDAESGAGREAP